VLLTRACLAFVRTPSIASFVEHLTTAAGVPQHQHCVEISSASAATRWFACLSLAAEALAVAAPWQTRNSPCTRRFVTWTWTHSTHRHFNWLIEKLLLLVAQGTGVVHAAQQRAGTNLPPFCPTVPLSSSLWQVEAKQHPELCGKPLGVVQYNPYGNLETRAPGERRIMNDSNGSLIAVRWARLWLGGGPPCLGAW
jgi:hypothetical protein